MALWCDSEGDGQCELGDSPICPQASSTPGYRNEARGQSLHKIHEVLPKLYPLRGQPQVRLDVDSRDAFGNDDDWLTRQHRPMLVDELTAFHLWPCSRHEPPIEDIEDCEALHSDPCHIPGFEREPWHINCGAAVHGAQTGTYMFCHAFNPGNCRKIKMPVSYEGHRTRLRHVIGGAIPNNCYPLMNVNCWGKNLDEDSNHDDYHLQDDWQRWQHTRLQWDGRAMFTPVRGDQTIELRNKALALLQADPVRFNADQIHRPETFGLEYTLSDVDEWSSVWNDEDPREPRGDLPVIDTVEGVVLKMRDVPVTVELVAVSSKVTMSLQIWRLFINTDVRDRTTGFDTDWKYYPLATIKIEMRIRPRVTIAPEHGVEVLQDVYALRGPVFSPPDELHYPGGWRPPQTLEWWGALGPYSEPRFERMRIPGGGEDAVCTQLRRWLSGQEIGGMETDWSRLDAEDSGEIEPRPEIYRGKVTIQGIGD